MRWPASRTESVPRRDEIVRATLRLLGEETVGELSTRTIARAVGISQPALFRHFRSRDAIVLAVLAHCRANLESLVQEVITKGGSAIDLLRSMFLGLSQFIEANPGLPRVLFADVPGQAKPVRHALRLLVSMQSTFATELVKDAQIAGALDRNVDAALLARSLLGMLQGAVLQWQLEGRKTSLAEDTPRLFSVWMHGSKNRVVLPMDASREEKATRGPGLEWLDVRPLLAQGTDPLETILGALKSLGPRGVLMLGAPFRPGPLLLLLGRRGYSVRCEESPSGLWTLLVCGRAAPTLEDLRDFEPPEPLERALVASAALEPGSSYLAIVPRYPRPLLDELEQRGFAVLAQETPDGAAIVYVSRPA